MSINMTNRLHREHRKEIILLNLQYLFFAAMLACMIAVSWFPERWIELTVTIVLLAFAGSVCKSSRS